MRKNKLFVNSRMAVGITLVMIIFTVLSFGTAFLIEIGSIQAETETDRIGSRNIFIILGLLFDISIVVFSVPKFFTQVEFTSSGIYLYIPFFKKKFFKYSSFRQITIATYNHVGVFPHYIVFSTRKLSKYEKTHINLVSDNNVIILRYTKKALRLVDKYRLTIK